MPKPVQEPGLLKTCVKATEYQRSFCYLSSFERIITEWDTESLSDHLELYESVKQLCAETVNPTGRVCRSKNSEHCFKTAFGKEAMEPYHRYLFEIKIVKGNNFKLGIAIEEAKKTPNQAPSDTEHGYAFFSTG